MSNKDNVKKVICVILLFLGALSGKVYAKELTTKDVEDICSNFDNPNSSNEEGYGYFPGYAIDECESDNKDPNLIRQCIFKRGGAIDIAILYANGRYVKQDLKKALSYVCYDDASTPMEKISMVETLFNAIKKGGVEKEFDWCNHVTSSDNLSVCFDRKQSETFQALHKKFKSLSTSFTTEQKNAYDSLLNHAFEFFDARARSEQDLTGSLRSIFITEWDRDQKKWLLEILESLEAGKLKVEKTDYSRINHEMQEEYKKLKEKFIESEKQDYSFHRIFDKGSIESTQEDFLAFRDAFAHFIHIRYPNISFENAKTWVTKIRIKQLKEL